MIISDVTVLGLSVVSVPSGQIRDPSSSEVVWFYKQTVF